jgi:hypothetical protein
MEGLIPIAVWTVIVLVGLGVLTITLFGARNVAYGKVNPLNIVMVLVPVLILIALGFAMDDWGQAGILTLLIMLGLAALSLLLSGLRSILGM